ncbi:hypothetical protein ACWGN5_39430 [Streptomyces sp. NPDC055815]
MPDKPLLTYTLIASPLIIAETGRSILALKVGSAADDVNGTSIYCRQISSGFPIGTCPNALTKRPEDIRPHQKGGDQPDQGGGWSARPVTNSKGTHIFWRWTPNRIEGIFNRGWDLYLELNNIAPNTWATNITIHVAEYTRLGSEVDYALRTARVTLPESETFELSESRRVFE